MPAKVIVEQCKCTAFQDNYSLYRRACNVYRVTTGAYYCNADFGGEFCGRVSVFCAYPNPMILSIIDETQYRMTVELKQFLIIALENAAIRCVPLLNERFAWLNWWFVVNPFVQYAAEWEMDIGKVHKWSDHLYHKHTGLRQSAARGSRATNYRLVWHVGRRITENNVQILL